MKNRQKIYFTSGILGLFFVLLIFLAIGPLFSMIKKNAKDLGETFEKELALVLVHGILHILGYNHEKGGEKAEKMIKKQEYYFSKLLTTNY